MGDLSHNLEMARPVYRPRYDDTPKPCTCSGRCRRHAHHACPNDAARHGAGAGEFCGSCVSSYLPGKEAA